MIVEFRTNDGWKYYEVSNQEQIEETKRDLEFELKVYSYTTNEDEMVQEYLKSFKNR